MLVQIILSGAVLLAISILVFLTWGKAKKLKLPPGPPGWPVIGNLPILFQKSATTNDQYYYTQCARQYGDVYKLTFGPQLVYVLCKFDYVREAFNHSDLQGRPPSVAHKIVFGPKAVGFAMASGSDWKVLRQFTMGLFRELGVNEGLFESTIKLELTRLTQQIDNFRRGETCWNLSELCYSVISNIMCGILFGHQFDYEEPNFKKVMNIMHTFSESMGPSAIVMTSRLLCHLPFGPGKRLKAVMNQFKEFLYQQIEERRKTFSPDVTKPNNFVDAFLLEMKDSGSADNAENKFNLQNLTTCCLELFYAGSETTSGTLSFAILCLATHPDVQEKLQKELDSHINKKHGTPSYADRAKLPYLQSFILENHRIAVATPLGIGHLAERDLQLFGYDVPKGTLLVPNVGSFFMNEERFPDPLEFKLERFLNADGEFEAIPDVFPFSIGRRLCAGELLARMEIFFTLVCLLRRYTFTPAADVQMPSILDARCGVTRCPLPYGVVISKRPDYEPPAY